MVECNRGCGSSDLHWKVVHGKYKLFNHNDLLHICNDGKIANKLSMEKATAKILNELGLLEPALIPMAETKSDADKDCENYHAQVDMEAIARAKDPSKMFTINTTANGIAITGDDKHNAIYLPKVAVPEILKALVDFI
jgi:hypothetical protein|tara:strand:- start:53 stop:466 length:414 start_codon:yes stop_codon:yes gene_type:complete